MHFKSDLERKKFWDSITQTFSEEQIDAALASLKPEVSRAIVMFCRSEHTLKEVEVIMQISGRTVRNNINQGMEKLFAYFRKQEG